MCALLFFFIPVNVLFSTLVSNRHSCVCVCAQMLAMGDALLKRELAGDSSREVSFDLGIRNYQSSYDRTPSLLMTCVTLLRSQAANVPQYFFPLES